MLPLLRHVLVLVLDRSLNTYIKDIRADKAAHGVANDNRVSMVCISFPFIMSFR